jgi:hypothetical protein|tara:strand:+ start:2207 stop:2599 length:393 start_codon:yes stop_codon:yes gene_type:complete
MKIFIQNMILNNSIEYTNIHKEDIIYTPNGLLFFKHKKWRKQQIKSEKYFSLEHNGYDMLIEDNVYEYNQIYTHIPYEHIVINETYKKYNIDYNLDLVKHTYLNETSYYFETKTVNNEQIDKIISFLLSK